MMLRLSTTIKMRFALVLFLGAVALGFEASAAVGVISASGAVNIRSTPGGKKLGTVDKDTRVSVVSVNGDWYGIRLTGGRVGYVKKSLIRTSGSVDTQNSNNDQARSSRENAPIRGVSSSARNEPKLFTMYRYAKAANGTCMDGAGSSAQDVLRRNGIRVQGNPSQTELNALAKGIAQVERLRGSAVPSSWRTSFNFISTSGGTRWNQGRAAINVRRTRSSGKGSNIGRLMHEFGHRVGNAGAYDRFKRYPGARSCTLTGYSGKRSNEQFAEVFSAYVTYPDLLRAKCPSAYNYFANDLFPGSQSKVATCSAARSDSNDEERPQLRTERQDNRPSRSTK